MLINNSIENTATLVIQPMDCKNLLQNKNVEFKEIDNYLFVGDILPKEGWVLHLSGIETHFFTIVNTVIPFLIECKSPFSIIKNKELAKLSLDGLLGYAQMGKLIAVYPENDVQALELATKLINLTAAFKGPAIPTDFLLKGIVYTLFAAYDNEGNYSCSISPTIPQNVTWPYEGITLPVLPTQKKLWNYKYRPLSMIKDDLKGRVIMANYFKNLFNIKLCVIKEGIQNVWSDRWERDIIDRLKWQYQLYTDLAGQIKTPHIFDFFYENGNAYLVMEYIKGDSLNGKIDSIYSGRCWQDLSGNDKNVIIDYLLNIISVINELHNHGFVHRDITPANFLINRRGELYLIDMELTYSLKHHKPEPAFRLGTPGYASPEQLDHQLPTVKEDIYAMGALMLYMFTGLTPVKVQQKDKQEMVDALCFLLKNQSLSILLISCLSDIPEERPNLAIIRDTINVFRQELLLDHQAVSLKARHLNINENDWCTCMNEALNGLMVFGRINDYDQWESLKKQGDKLNGYQPVERIVQPGFQTGVAGIIWLLSRAQEIGYDITRCKQAYSSSIEFIEKAILDPEINTPVGLYDGLAGISLAIYEGTNAQILSINTYAQYLEQCYRKEASGLDLANGIAGQGLSLLQCKNAIPKDYWEPILEKYVQQLLTQQQKDGSWNICRSKRKPNDILLGLSNGIAGLLLFLIEYDKAFPNEDVSFAIRQGLGFLIKNIHRKGQDHYWNTTTKSKSIEKCGCNIGIPGIALVFIKAYEHYKDPFYKKIVEKTLYALPLHPVYNDFTQASGLSGLGEVYLEAKRVFAGDEWQERADWIARLFFHTFQRNTKGAGFWSVNANPDPEPDLMTGNCGIIHFLMRYLTKGRLPYILKSL